MRIKVNPNRMELHRLRRRLAFARRGHKLLKDKQEDLMHKFLAEWNKAISMRRQVEEELEGICRHFLAVRVDMDPETIGYALECVSPKCKLDCATEAISGLRVPVCQLRLLYNRDVAGVSGSPGLGFTVLLLRRVANELIELAYLENRLRLMAEELNVTRRRVNALEYNLIPSLEGAIRFVSTRLGELERASLTRLMKVKDIVRAH